MQSEYLFAKLAGIGAECSGFEEDWDRAELGAMAVDASAPLETSQVNEQQSDLTVFVAAQQVESFVHPEEHPFVLQKISRSEVHGFVFVAVE